MGPGMMGGYGPGSNLNLSAEQRSKIGKIQDDARRKQWELMGKMQDEQAQMNEQYYSDNRDDAALSKNYRRMSDLRHQMFDLSLSTQKQTDAVLTKEQHDKSRRNGYGMWGTEACDRRWASGAAKPRRVHSAGNQNEIAASNP